MPRKNRVGPLGEITAASARGTLMGNRGCLHDESGNLIRSSARAAWVTCLLKFNGRKREVMSPGQYTELFFLDEATALAAGHRPCATCQRQRYLEFKRLWTQANPGAGDHIQQIDRQLQRERLASGGLSWPSEVAQLVDGVFVVRGDNPHAAFLYWRGRMLPWSPDGYGPPATISSSDRVNVITPLSICRTIAAGFIPRVHASASASASVAPSDTDVCLMHAQAPVPPEVITPATNSWGLAAAPDGWPTLFKPSVTPTGRELFIYFAAILEVTGMDKSVVFPLQKFMGNFIGHVSTGRIEKFGHGYRLTAAGRAYFSNRFNPHNPQHISRAEVDMWAQRIRRGGSGWFPI